ncbi:MAG: phosphopantothenoylcysteine decarboxylase, partial [Armatimonadetes bacterium]|nr:phosphopantothenoylcysteine decarboxylase [Armatimonadota bacterium]
GVELVPVTSAADLLEAVRARAAESDLVIGAAAVGDYAPVAPAADKPAKAASLALELRPTVDVIAEVGAGKRPGQVVVGFAAETHDLLAHAADKLRRKKLDLIVANDVTAAGSGFGVDTNQVVLLFADGRRESLPLQSKRAVAEAVLTAALGLLPSS